MDTIDIVDLIVSLIGIAAMLYFIIIHSHKD